jgi:hypothetical protein
MAFGDRVACRATIDSGTCGSAASLAYLQDIEFRNPCRFIVVGEFFVVFVRLRLCGFSMKIQVTDPFHPELKALIGFF